MPERRTGAEIVDRVAGGAHRLFLERSPSAVSMREIAAEADVNLGLIHRYVGSKEEVIALVLRRHTERARTAIETVPNDELPSWLAHAVTTRPETGRLLAGMILDGVDVADLKGDFPLLSHSAARQSPLDAATSHALALGWEVFGPSLLAALDIDAEPAEVEAAVRRSLLTLAAQSKTEEATSPSR